MEITKPELLNHIREIQCRYVKFFNKYMKIMAYGGKPDNCMYEWLQMLRNYIRILKQAYEDYHLICERIPSAGGSCTSVTALVRETMFTVTTLNIDGTVYDESNLPPSPYNTVIGSVIDIVNTTQFTWPPFLGDSNGEFVFDPKTGLLTLDLGEDGTMYLSLNFNCDATEVVAYSVLEDSEGNLQYAVYTMDVEEVDFETSDSGCCQLSSLEETVMSTVGKYVYLESGSTYIDSNTEEFPEEVYSFGENSVEIYVDGELLETLTYTYDFTTGQITFSNGDIGFLQFTCSFDNVILNLYHDNEGSIEQETIYFSIDDVGYSTCVSEKCTPEYSYCLTNTDIQNMITKSYEILNQVCDC